MNCVLCTLADLVVNTSLGPLEAARVGFIAGVGTEGDPPELCDSCMIQTRASLRKAGELEAAEALEGEGWVSQGH